MKQFLKRFYAQITQSLKTTGQRIFSIQSFRFIKLHFYQRFFLYFSRIFVILLIIITLGVGYLYFAHPEKISRIYAKSKVKFIEVIDSKIFGSYKVEISGNKQITTEEIEEIVLKTISQKNYHSKQSLLIQDIVDNLKTNLPWLKEVTIVRTMPGKLNIFINEYKPLAIWNHNDKLSFIDEQGNQMPYYESDEFDDMIIVSGPNANIKYKSLFNIFSLNEEVSQQVYSATWIGNRRWNIRFKNGILVKLPENKISRAWERLGNLQEIKGSSIGLKVIDLRVADKIYLEYEDKIRKTLN